MLASFARIAAALVLALPTLAVAKRPNIVFIMSDDHAFQAISAYDQRLVQTPNIDRLASEGIRFDRAFVGNSICSPSRATLLTGKHSHASSVRNNLDVFDGSQQTLQSLFQAGGYETAMIGKWHLKSEPTGFDHWEVLPGQGDYYNPKFLNAQGGRQLTGYVTDVITDLAVEWLQGRGADERPFLLFYHHKAPHREWWPSPEELTDFDAGPWPEPETLFDDYAGRQAAAEAEMRISDHMGLSNDNKIAPANARALGHEPFMDWYEGAYERQTQEHMNDEQRALAETVYGPINEEFLRENRQGDELTRWKYQRYLQDYLSTIRSVDRNVGRLLEQLEAAGQLDDTLIVYTSDQGFYLGEHGWFDKRFMYEESFRTPLIMRWPGRMQEGGSRQALVQNIDFAPTLLDAAGLDVPKDMHGKSLVPLFQDDDSDFREALYYHYYEYPGIHAAKRHYGVRNDRYKLIHFYYDIDSWEFYDLQEDPQELNNLIDDPAYAEPRAEALRQLVALRQQFGDSAELDEALLEQDLSGGKSTDRAKKSAGGR